MQKLNFFNRKSCLIKIVSLQILQLFIFIMMHIQIGLMHGYDFLVNKLLMNEVDFSAIQIKQNINLRKIKEIVH